jgi:hypothetical protein
VIEWTRIWSMKDWKKEESNLNETRKCVYWRKSEKKNY